MASMVKGTISITAVLILATVVMAAQSERGTIRGTVTDATGSVMPGVAVKAVNVDTGIETSTVTTDAAPQLKSETSDVVTAVNPKTFIDLPLNAGGGRSAESFIFLSPGTTGNTFDAHINGSQTLSKEIQLDGLSMTIAEVGGDPRVLTLPPDALQEFSIATGSYSAEFGNTGGGVE